MNAEQLRLITFIWMALAAGTFVLLFFVTAPFGRHSKTTWGPTIPSKWGWFIMELPSLAIMLYFLITGSNTSVSYVWILFALWIIHYTNRTIVYPLRIRESGKRMPLVITGSAIFFNLMNAGLNGYFLAEIADPEQYGSDWLNTPHFIAGILLFVTGMVINHYADNKLIHLRKKGEGGYQIPYGLLFNRISSPNLLGEIIEWTGFAVMAWNLPGWSFAVWTFANLVPRAIDHHKWYLKKFPDYPAGRKAVFPFIL